MLGVDTSTADSLQGVRYGLGVGYGSCYWVLGGARDFLGWEIGRSMLCMYRRWGNKFTKSILLWSFQERVVKMNNLLRNYSQGL
jgi:hypothetical protein